MKANQCQHLLTHILSYFVKKHNQQISRLKWRYFWEARATTHVTQQLKQHNN